MKRFATPSTLEVYVIHVQDNDTDPLMGIRKRVMGLDCIALKHFKSNEEALDFYADLKEHWGVDRDFGHTFITRRN